MKRRTVILGSLGYAAASILLQPALARTEPQTLPSEMIADILKLNGRITLGARNADVTLIEFFDYNCPYCRHSSQDITPLLAKDKNLEIILINYAVLSEASILASKVALAFSMQRANRYLEFHQKLFVRKGIIGAEAALDVSAQLGADKTRLLKDADSDAVTKALIASAKLGENLGLNATPSYIIGNQGLQGYVSLSEKTSVITNMRACEKISC